MQELTAKLLARVSGANDYAQSRVSMRTRAPSFPYFIVAGAKGCKYMPLVNVGAMRQVKHFRAHVLQLAASPVRAWRFKRRTGGKSRSCELYPGQKFGGE